MRAVLDPNVLISAVLSENGPPAELLRRWQRGEFDLVISAELVAELARALAYPKLRKLVPEAVAAAYVDMVRESGSMNERIGAIPAVRSRDPGDDYLIALAMAADALLISGDADLLSLADRAPIETPRQFLQRLEKA
ncbi:MAG: putative toxin-antitoxin system toxin component, PIN family [Solirubrobacterales bacterium]|nr:putative toxin-antitoxin system toxin component, PIN family [Solirubrobacterales bacterium]